MCPLPDRIIDYGRPKPPITAWRVFAGVCGVPAGIVGLLATAFRGFNLVAFLFLGEGPTRDRPGNAFVAALILFIGVAGSFAAIRWARYAMRRVR